MQPISGSALEKFARDVASHAIYETWPIYLIVAILSILASIFASYFGARSSKSGELAAAKENLDEILRQLKATTEASKSVEIALSHGDWIKKEENTLRRKKLEELINAAFAIATWTQENYIAGLQGNEPSTKAPIDEFEMLCQLYFPEIRAQTHEVEMSYRRSMQDISPLRQFVMSSKVVCETLLRQEKFDEMLEELNKQSEYLEQNKQAVLAGTIVVYTNVQALSIAARSIMQELISAPAVRR